LAPLTLREAYRYIIATSAQSPVVIEIEPLLLEEPVLKLRVHLGTSCFVDVFFSGSTTASACRNWGSVRRTSATAGDLCIGRMIGIRRSRLASALRCQGRHTPMFKGIARK
jgi:hypothetical protein